MMKKSIIFAIVLLFACTSCRQNEVKILSLQEKMNAKVSELTEMNELGTVEYKVTKVVKASDDAKWYQFGDRKILFQCTAYLKAGVNLNKFDPSKVKVNEKEKSVVVVLPKAELLSFNMPPESARMVYEKVSITRFDFSAQERNLLLQQGEKEIRDNVPTMGILQDAEKNAAAFFKSLLSQMGFESIIIKFA
jgi:hypothetical protein